MQPKQFDVATGIPLRGRSMSYLVSNDLHVLWAKPSESRIHGRFYDIEVMNGSAQVFVH